MLASIDFTYLKKPLIFFSVALVISIGLIWFGIEFESTKLDQYEKERSNLVREHRRYSQLVEDIDLLEQYTDQYREYTSSGLIGPERRLSWIETLEQVNQEIRLPLLRYSLLPQEEFQLPGFRTPPKIKIYSTPMLIDLEMLHEADLFSVLYGISEQVSQLLTVDSCELNRPSADAVLSTKKTNMMAKCKLRWVTVDVQ